MELSFSGLKASPRSIFSFRPKDKPEKFGNSFFYPIWGASTIEWDGKKYLQDFLEVPEVNAIIKIKARAFSNMKLSIVSKRTGEEVNNQEQLVRALRQPNYFQGQKEFLLQTKIFKEVFGNEFIFFLTPVGMPNSVKGIFTLSAENIDIDIKDKTPYFKLQDYSDGVVYTYDWYGTKIPLDPNSFIHINNNKADIEEDDYLWGNSTMQSLQAPIRNLRASYEARNVLIENRGALGILSNNSKDGIGATLPMDPKEKDDLQQEFRRYGMTKSQWQVIITNLNLSWQQMAIDADKLKLFEETTADTKIIAQEYGVPFELLEKDVKFADKKEAEKQLYQDTIIPEAQEWISALNTRFETMDKSWEIRGTFDHLPVFQEDISQRATALNTMVSALNAMLQVNAITMEQYQNELKKFGI